MQVAVSLILNMKSFYILSRKISAKITLFPIKTQAKFTLFPKQGQSGGLGGLEFSGDFVEGNGHEGGFAGGGAVGDFAAQQVGQQGGGGLQPGADIFFCGVLFGNAQGVRLEGVAGFAETGFAGGKAADKLQHEFLYMGEAQHHGHGLHTQGLLAEGGDEEAGLLELFSHLERHAHIAGVELEHNGHQQALGVNGGAVAVEQAFKNDALAGSAG